MNPHVLIINRSLLQAAACHVGIGPIAEIKLRSGDFALTSIAINEEAEAFGLVLQVARLYVERGEDGYAIAMKLAYHLWNEWSGGEPLLRFSGVRLED